MRLSLPMPPLQHTYQSLLDNQPQVAWQELQIALDQQTLDSELWLPVKQEILSQTQCGTSLKQSAGQTPHSSEFHSTLWPIIAGLSNQNLC